MKAQAKVDLDDTATIDGEVDRLAGFVVQLYDTMRDALAGAYAGWKPAGRPVYPMVVTLDEWLPSGRSLIHRLEDKVREGLLQRDIPIAVLEDHPFTLCSLYEFEAAASLARQLSARVRQVKEAVEADGGLNIGDALPVWISTEDALEGGRRRSTLDGAVKPAGYWHLHIRRGATATLVAFAAPNAGGEWDVLNVTGARLAPKVQAALAWIDRRIPQPGSASLLIAPATVRRDLDPPARAREGRSGQQRRPNP